MTVKILPSVAAGSVSAPPSKSMAHRALICGALSQGSNISNLAASEDIKATLSCLKALGAQVAETENGVHIGAADVFCPPEGAVLNCNESGSTLRFLLPLCLLSGKEITLTGTDRLFARPLSIYEDICREQGISFIKDENSVTVQGKLKSGDYQIPGNISSQFITGLLYTLPLLAGDSRLEVTGVFESASYIDLTLSALGDFGIQITRQENTFYIPGAQHYRAADYTVEGDMSNAAFLEGFNLLGGNVCVRGINENTLQGDRVYLQMFRDLQQGKKDFDLSDCPDLGPVMFALAANSGGARFTGTRRLKIKESDRAEAMAAELLKLGIACTIEENSVQIHPGNLCAPKEPLQGHNDHRIVMALSLLLTKTGGCIEGAQAVKKSYPDFFEVIKTLGIQAICVGGGALDAPL